MEIYKEFSFEAAHFLPAVPPGHKCKQVHGHSYWFRVYLKGKPGTDSGWIMDFKVIKNIVSPIIEQLDHKMLNEIPGLENPTAENITVWLWEKLEPYLENLNRIELKETATSGVIYHGETVEQSNVNN
jgi:6-pyruvoyltetrahydropterin/6-carboxytetrahydropterin synthase